MWNLSKMSWDIFTPSFVSPKDLEEYISDRKLDFTCSRPTSESVALESAENKLYALLANASNSNADIINFIEDHLRSFTRQTCFIRMLVKNVCKACIHGKLRKMICRIFDCLFQCCP